MNERQEIRAKALESSITILALLPDKERLDQLASWQQQGLDPKQALINSAKIFENYLTDQG